MATKLPDDNEFGRSIEGETSTGADYQSEAPDDEDLPLDDELIENDDGTVTVLSSEKEEKVSEGFDENMAETLIDAKELDLYAAELVEFAEQDLEDRAERDKQYEEGLQRSGLGDDAPGGASFNGASKVVHPIIAETCVDFGSSAIKELFPSDGPVRTKEIGDIDPQRLQIAENKKIVLNWQLTRQIPEYRPELEQMLSQLPMGGSQYLKFRMDVRRQRPTIEFVGIDNLIIPSSASYFYDAQRITHRQYITEQDFRERVKSGLYKDIDLPDEQFIEKSKAEEANDKIEGKEDSVYNIDGLRTIYEMYVWKYFEDDPYLKEEDEYAPYIIHIDYATKKVLGLFRNWDEQDPIKEKLDWIVEFGFIPWRGAYCIGLPHLIGSLSAALTGTLRAILDSAHISNAATGLKLKGSRVVGQDVEIAITQLQEIEGPATCDDIRKLVMPLPFPGPNAVLFQLLGFLGDTARGVVTTAEEKIADSSNQMPVGTTLALIEQGSKVASAIYARLHHSQAKCLSILCRLNKECMTPEIQQKGLGKVLVQLQDFADSSDIIPVSDPNIFSEAQRFAQTQAIMQMQMADAADPGVPWNKYAVRLRLLRQMHVQNPNELLPPPPVPVTADPVSENVAVMSGAMLKAAPQQDHYAHALEHLDFILDPFIENTPTLCGPALQSLLGHIQEHYLMYYQSEVQKMQGPLQQHDQQQDQKLQMQISQLVQTTGMQPSPLPPSNTPDKITQIAGALLRQHTNKEVQDLIKKMIKAKEIADKKMPPQPMDPVQATLKASMAEIERKAEHDKVLQDIEKQKQEHDAQMEKNQVENERHNEQFKLMLNDHFERVKQQSEEEREQQRLASEEMMQHLALVQKTAQSEMEAQLKVISQIASAMVSKGNELSEEQLEEARAAADPNQAKSILVKAKDVVNKLMGKSTDSIAAKGSGETNQSSE